MRTRYFNLRVPTKGSETEAVELVVADGRFEEILPAGSVTAAGDDQWEFIKGALVLPGVIDGHVHFDDPGFTQREDFASGTSAAAAGGVTCVVDMPCTSLPPVITTEALENKLKVIGPKAHVDYMLWGGVGKRGHESAVATAPCRPGRCRGGCNQDLHALRNGHLSRPHHI